MKFFKRIIKLFIFIIIISIIFIYGLYFYAKKLPMLEIRDVNNFYLYDNNNNLYFQGIGQNEWVDLDNISDYVIKGTLEIEDHHFYQHHGFDLKRIIKALLTNIKKGKVVEEGSHEELMNKRGYYYELIKQQTDSF